MFRTPWARVLIAGAMIATVFAACGPQADNGGLVFDEENSAQPLTENMLYSRAIVWRPADGSRVSLNPPRFSWPYEPTIMLPAGVQRDYLPVRHYRFQIARDNSFEQLIVDRVETPFNFYNILPVLPEDEMLYWRVGYYHPEDRHLEWSDTREFTIELGATSWDRVKLGEPRFRSEGHPRIIFTPDNIGELRELARNNEFSQEIYEKVVDEAHRDLGADWFIDFPSTDTVPDESLRELYSDIPPWLDPDGGDAPYLLMIERLMGMAFAWMLTGDEQFLAVKERLLTVAGWGAGGQTAPEGMGGSEDYVALNEYLSLFYDWFYNEMTPAERGAVLGSLRWRTRHIVYNYSWRQREGERVYPYSVAVCGSSHPFENMHYTMPAGLAAWEEGGVFETAYQLAVNYYSGVNSPFGPEDAWNEGPGYGLSKFKWMVNAVSYYDMSLEGAGFGRNPFLTNIGEFFTRMAVLGLPHLSFGNIGIMEPYYLNNRVSSFRKLAFLTGNGRFLRSWVDALDRLGQIGYSTHRRYFRPWIEYALPHFYPEPDRLPKVPRARLLPDGGWVAASTHDPASFASFPKSVGINFHARPRGAFNHSFYGDNSFQIYAWGENITHAGGSTMNGDRHAHHSMAQNVVLVDGLGQAQPRHLAMENFHLDVFEPWFARVSRFAEQGGTVYFKGEAAKSYVQFPFHYYEFWGHLGDGENDPYDERDVRYLKRADRHVLFVDGRYFVMLDDLAVDREARPQGSLFSWLYHVLQDVPLNWDPETRSFAYEVGGVSTKVKVVSDTPFEFEDRLKEQGLINPLTGEDYREWARPIRLYDKNYDGPYPEVVTHNVWVTNIEPAHEVRYLTVIYPWREGEPEPRIEELDGLTVRVRCGGRQETVTFDPQLHPDADIRVEP